MAVRTPLYWDGTGLAEMTSAMIDDCVDEMIRQYGLNPSVTVSFVSSGGTLGAISDTRLRSGESNVRANGFALESATGEPQTVTVNYARMSGASASVSTPADTANKAFPVFYNSTAGAIQSMSLTDMRDTFVAPALQRLVTNGYTSTVTNHDGMFFISTGNGTSDNHLLVSGTPVFVNTRANTSSFLASNIGTNGTTQDFPITVSNYYLRKFKRQHATGSNYLGPTTPMQINGSDDLQAFTEANFGTILQEAIRDAAVNVAGSRISYSLGATVTGTAMGTGMADTKLNGAGNYQTRFVNANDYRAQEFPNGTAVAINTYYLQASLF